MKKKMLRLCLVCTLGGTLMACADQLGEKETGCGARGLAVRYDVSDMQFVAAQKVADADHATPGQGHAARKAMMTCLGLSPSVLSHTVIPMRPAAGLPSVDAVETVLPGVDVRLPEEVAKTRGTITTMNNLANFSTRAYSKPGIGETANLWFDNRETNKSGALVSNTVYWDRSHGWARFYAVSPLVETRYDKIRFGQGEGEASPVIDFEVEKEAKQQKDLMFACSGDVTYAGEPVAPQVQLPFKHALAAIRFAVGKFPLEKPHKITKIEIEGACTKGRCSLPSDKMGAIVWQEQSNAGKCELADISVDVKDAHTLLTGTDKDNYTFFMIPQKVNGKVKVKVFFDGNDKPAYTLSPKNEWKAGTTYQYALAGPKLKYVFYATFFPPHLPNYYNGLFPSNNAYGSVTIQSFKAHYDKWMSEYIPVTWNVVGYDSNGDGVYSMSERPTWLKTFPETGEGGEFLGGKTVELAANTQPVVWPYDKPLQEAAPMGKPGKYYNLANQTDGNDKVENTANCYVISAPGHYRLPLVYGNAIKDSKPNTAAYTTTESGDGVLQTFTDYADQPITSPYINASAMGKATKAALEWADSKDLVTDMKVMGDGKGEHDFLCFEVKKENIRNGNAVVSVKDEKGTVMWSWHLWFAPKECVSTIECTNKNNESVHFMRDPLGTRLSQEGAERKVRIKIQQVEGDQKPIVMTITQKAGLAPYSITYYQYGRKDAFPGEMQPAIGNIDHIVECQTIGYTVQHPARHVSTSGMWTKPAYYNLWSGAGSTANKVVKTIYDPCPVGFKVASENDFSGFDKQRKSGSFKYGWDIRATTASDSPCIFFPAAGNYYNIDDKLLFESNGTSCDYLMVQKGKPISVFEVYKRDVSTSGSFRLYWASGVRAVAE